jgi:hypothetical protein
MQTSTGKELAVRTDEIRELLKETLEHHKHCGAARGAVENGQQLALFHAWQAGIRLNKMKPLVGHGNWQEWLETNFCEPRGVEYRTAAMYMKIDNDNAELRSLTKPNVRRVADLKFDSIRKYRLGFVPEKEQPEHAGNIRFSRLATFLNCVNEFNRIEQRYREGLQDVDFVEAREETVRMKQFLDWLHGDQRSANPWSTKHPQPKDS